MADEFQVTCITKKDRTSSHEHITHIGNISKKWKLTRESAIRRIEGKTESYYTLDNNSRKIYIGVVRGDGQKAPYLRTYADGKWSDNLLALPECTSVCVLID